MIEIAGFLERGNLAKNPRLLQKLKDIYTDMTVNTTDCSVIGDAAGPAVYLLKVLVRQHGFHSLNRVFKKCQWIIPKGLHVEPVEVYNRRRSHYNGLLDTEYRVGTL